MSELIAIREAARRLGVSDTAVTKAMKVGRVSAPLDEDRDPRNGRPRLRWPNVETEWIANTDATRRTHVGSQGSPRRQAPDQPPTVLETARARTPEPPPPGADDGAEGTVTIHDGINLTEAKTAKEIYNARLARAEYEEQIGKLVPIETVKADAFKLARTVRDGLLNLPDRVAHELAHETDPSAVHLRLSSEIRLVLEAIATA